MENNFYSEINDLGLDISDIATHLQRIKGWAEDRSDKTLPILDTCRIDNGLIIPWQKLRDAISDVTDVPKNFVAFVPSAGAASRYFKPFAPILYSIEKGDFNKAAEDLRELEKDGFSQWVLPEAILEALHSENPLSYFQENQESIIEALSLPKALQPVAPPKLSFLDIKIREHSVLKGLCGQVFIVPHDKKSSFEVIQTENNNSSLSTTYIEQGPSLSTIRFNLDGSPYRDNNNCLSPVPAGHGTLTKLFPEVLKKYPEAHSAFIRNIDNISKDPDTFSDASSSFFKFHFFILEKLKEIRNHLSEGKLAAAEKVAEIINSKLLGQKRAIDENEYRSELWRLLFDAFHCSEGIVDRYKKNSDSELDILLKLFNRPFNCLGQVANNGKDIGGTPVVTQSNNTRFSICLELPHASQRDVKDYLSDPNKATHFNPVFVTAELIKDSHEIYEPENSEFWILAHKTFNGSAVVYHETVLYELLGNSIMANTLFVEIPRSLFNPHKTLHDSIDSPASNWSSINN